MLWENICFFIFIRSISLVLKWDISIIFVLNIVVLNYRCVVIIFKYLLSFLIRFSISFLMCVFLFIFIDFLVFKFVINIDKFYLDFFLVLFMIEFFFVVYMM